MASRGGARPNTGPKPGTPFKKTIEKKEAEKVFHQLILKKLSRLTQAQFNLAEGLTYVYKIVESGTDKNPKREHVLVTDPIEIQDFLNENDGGDGEVDGTYYYITTKAPDGKAIDSLIDRVFGKPKQSVEVDNPNETAALREFNEKMNQMIENDKLRTKQLKGQNP